MRNVLFSVWKYLSFALCVWFLPLEQWIHATGLPEAAQNSLVLMLCHFHRALQDLCTYGYMCVTGRGYTNPSPLPVLTVSTPVSRAKQAQRNNGRRNPGMFAVKFQFCIQ